jgi:hypothetical protein
MTADTSIRVKICFVMDCTGSMEPWIEQAKTRITEITDNVSMDSPNARCTVGFVGYRDYGDREQAIVVPFQHPEDAMERIQGVYADGGDDIAEDVAHGLQNALNMDWSGADVRMIVHIADAPAHGFMYHSPLISDRYPRGDPAGLNPEDILQRLSSLDIDFTFVRINDSTDTMLEAFYNSYAHDGSFRVLDLRPQAFGTRRTEDTSTLLPPLLSRAITQSIGQRTISQETQYY